MAFLAGRDRHAPGLPVCPSDVHARTDKTTQGVVGIVHRGWLLLRIDELEYGRRPPRSLLFPAVQCILPSGALWAMAAFLIISTWRGMVPGTPTTSGCRYATTAAAGHCFARGRTFPLGLRSPAPINPIAGKCQCNKNQARHAYAGPAVGSPGDAGAGGAGAAADEEHAHEQSIEAATGLGGEHVDGVPPDRLVADGTGVDHDGRRHQQAQRQIAMCAQVQAEPTGA